MLIDLIVNMIQSTMLTAFLINCFGVKNRENKKITVYAIGIFITFMYLELPEIFWIRSMAVLYIPLAVLFCHLFLQGNILEHILYCVMMMSVVAFTSFFILGIAEIKEISPIMIQLSSQLVIAIMLLFLVFIKKKLSGIFNKKYTFIFMFIPLCSIFLCSSIIGTSHSTDTIHNIKSVFSIVCIISLNFVELYLFIKLHDFYNNNLLISVQLESYRRREKDLEEMKKVHLDVKKMNHEIQRVIKMTKILLKQGEIEKAISYLTEFEKEKSDCITNKFVSDNIILNAVLNQKIGECDKNKISTSCIVTGQIQGISDIDLHILIENLLDNAIEACKEAEEKKIDLIINASEEFIIIDIGNSITTSRNIDQMTTTKSDKSVHGFGIMNVKNIVEKYDGDIEYKLLQKNYIQCTAMIEKK